MPLKLNTSNPRLQEAAQRFNLFLDWWLQNLTECLPSSLRRGMPKAQSRIQLLVGRHDAFLSVDGGGWIALATEDAEKAQYGGQAADVVIADDAVLFRSMELPREILNDLQGAVAFQVKQHIPMDEGAVALGHRIADREGAQAKVRLKIAAVRHRTINRAFEVAKACGLVPKRFQTASDNVPLSIVQITRAAQLQRLAVIGSIGVLFLQFLIIPALDSRRVRASNEVLKTELNTLVGKTKSAADLKRAVDERVNDAEILNTQIAQDIFAEGLARLSTQAPDDVWLSEIQFDGRVFRLSGTAADAAGWALKLQQQPDVFETVRLEGVSGSGADGGRFQMNVQFKRAGQEK